MKNLFLFSFLLAGNTAFAQPLQTLYYENGRKCMEGHWTYTKRDMVPQVNNIENGGTQQQPKQYGQSDEGRPDADNNSTSSQSGNGWYKASNPAAFLHISPKGLFTYWQPRSPDYVQITYAEGVPNGPYTEYYGSGQIAQTGNLVNGMPDGPWTYYYKNGKTFYTGTYKAYSQSQLEGLWAFDSGVLNGDPKSASVNWANELYPVKRLSSIQNTDFSFFDRLLQGAPKEGRFDFLYRDGSPKAQLFFKENMPAGTWKIWRSAQKIPALVLEWQAGRLTYVTDSTGRRQLLEAVMQDIELQRQVQAASEEAEPYDRTILREAAPWMARTRRPATKGKSVFKAYEYAEQKPEFGSDYTIWLASNLRYPPAARKEGAQGQVEVNFIIQADGRVTDAVVEKSVRPDLDAEALRLVNAMPAWKVPGRQWGRAVPVYFAVLVKFNLR